MRISTYCGWLGVVLIISLAGMAGVVLYTQVACCDPYQVGIINLKIKKSNHFTKLEINTL